MTTLVAALLLGTLGAPPQDSATLAKKFTAGEKERFAVKLSLSIAIGDVDIDMKTEQRVLKVFENGEAELETELLEIKTRINGEAIDTDPKAEVRKTKLRVNRMGMPVSSADSALGFNFLHFVGLLGDKPLQVGKKTDVQWTDPGEPKRSAKGAVTLESLADGQAKLASSWEINTPSSPKPLKIDMNSVVDVPTGKLLKASGTILGAQSRDVEVRAIQFSMEAVK